jgi:TldD protein
MAENAVDIAVQRGASYADIRILYTEREDILIRNGQIAEMDLSEDIGLGIRVLVDGAWGFASSAKVDRDEIKQVADLAVKIARASASLKNEDVRLAAEPIHRDTWITPYTLDPFKVPITDKLALLFKVDEELRKSPQIVVAESAMSFKKRHQWTATSEGSLIDQTFLRSGAGFSATAVKDGDVQVRSYPCAHGGQFMSCGYELIPALRLAENAVGVREEAVALLEAKECPSGKLDLVLESSQMALQIHESVGHPTELDRVLGMEANFAGTSFATTEKLNDYQYGSSIVNLICDNTIPGGLATAGYDDDAVRMQRWPIVQEGRFVGYQFNRELAHEVQAERSVGSNRAQNWSHIPIVRNSNLSLMPGDVSESDLIASVEEGIYMASNRSWSIDQKRLNFQFGCEIAWEIKEGKLGRMLKNPNYQGITPEFWRSCALIADADSWILWGLPNCGKGQPMQTVEMSHGASPALFRNVTVGVKG